MKYLIIKLYITIKLLLKILIFQTYLKSVDKMTTINEILQLNPNYMQF